MGQRVIRSNCPGGITEPPNWLKSHHIALPLATNHNSNTPRHKQVTKTRLPVTDKGEYGIGKMKPQHGFSSLSTQCNPLCPGVLIWGVRENKWSRLTSQAEQGRPPCHIGRRNSWTQPNRGEFFWSTPLGWLGISQEKEPKQEKKLLLQHMRQSPQMCYIRKHLLKTYIAFIIFSLPG